MIITCSFVLSLSSDNLFRLPYFCYLPSPSRLLSDFFLSFHLSLESTLWFATPSFVPSRPLSSNQDHNDHHHPSYLIKLINNPSSHFRRRQVWSAWRWNRFGIQRGRLARLQESTDLGSKSSAPAGPTQLCPVFLYLCFEFAFLYLCFCMFAFVFVFLYLCFCICICIFTLCVLCGPLIVETFDKPASCSTAL